MARPQRAALAAFLAVALTSAAACGVSDAVSPVDAPSQSASPVLSPSAANRSLVGVPNGAYVFTFETSKAQSLVIGGGSRLDIPARAICRLDSGYGADYWNRECSAETGRMTITVIASGAGSAHPRLDFYPALRFSPRATVMLYMYGKELQKADADKWQILYCDDARTTKCVNEALTDPSLASSVDRSAGVIFRRIKHFSGYLVAE